MSTPVPWCCCEPVSFDARGCCFFVVPFVYPFLMFFLSFAAIMKTTSLTPQNTPVPSEYASASTLEGCPSPRAPSSERRGGRGAPCAWIWMLMALIFAVATGCSQPGPRTRSDAGAAKVDRTEAIKTTGRQKAVLSLHMKKAFPDACTYGVTLTNNLHEKITNITFRFSAYIDGGVFFQYVTKNFYELKPTSHMYRELTFTQISCDRIDYLTVSDPGRCAIGKSMTRFSTKPGDCIKYVDIAPSPHIELVRK